MRMNAKELIAEARVTAPTLPPAAAKLMTAMADRLDLQFVALCESRNEVKQLAAENAALKSNLMFWDAEDPEVPYCSPEDIANEIMLGYNEEFDVQVAARLPNRKYRVCKLTEREREIELVDGGDIATPTTDAILASLRAEGVEMFANHQQKKYDNLASSGKILTDTGFSHYLSGEASTFAAQLRSKSEVQS